MHGSLHASHGIAIYITAWVGEIKKRVGEEVGKFDRSNGKEKYRDE
jgi:hypothetical protein